MRIRIALLLLLACVPLHAQSAAPSGERVPASLERRIYVGIGAGYEAGNGLRLGWSIGRHGLESGFGMTYAGETGEMNYSYGFRYLNTLYEGAYVWTGWGRMGHHRASERASLSSGGAGLGMSLRLGPMFRLMLDSGMRAYSDSEVADGDIQINPTFNGAIVYIW